MIDIHSHIIFDVDDGPKTIEESLSLLRESYSQGVRGIVATSHRRKGMFETAEEKIDSHFKLLESRVKEVADDLLLFYGGEIYFTEDVIAKLEAGIFPTYAKGRSVLIEFSSFTPYKTIQDAANQIIRLGLTPIIAHIERYDCLSKDLTKVEELVNMGCYTQVNSSSVLKPKLFGDKHKVYKQRTHQFLEQDLVHFVASDMHNLDNRPPYMREAYQFIVQHYGHNRAEDLFVTNPLALLQNKL